MPVTFTANAAQPGVQPKGGHIGVQTEVFTIDGPSQSSAGDVILACKIPNFATVIDCMVRFGRGGTDSVVNVFVAKTGDGSASSIFSFGVQTLSSTVAGAAMFRPGVTFQGPTRISLSDDAAVQHALLKIGIVSGSTTTSFSLNGYVTYAMDEF